MYRRKVLVTASAVFAIGVALAAQPTSLHSDWSAGAAPAGSLWIPGVNMLMSAHETDLSVLTPPR